MPGGIVFDPTKVVGDLTGAWRVRGSANALAQPVDFVAWFNIRAGLNHDDPATADLQQVTVAAAGALSKAAGAEIEFTPLLSSSAQSGPLDASAIRDNPDPARILGEFKPEGGPRVIAARVRGVLKSAFAAAPDLPAGQLRPAGSPEHRAQTDGPANLVVVADTDILADRFWVRTADFFGQSQVTPFSDNGPFVANLVGTLAGGDALIELRSRGRSLRPFERVEAMQMRAEASYRQTEKALQTHLSEVERKLTDLRSGREGASAVTTAEQRAAIDDLRRDVNATRRKLRGVQLELRRDIATLETRLRLFDIVLVPAVLAVFAVALGLSVAGAARGRGPEEGYHAVVRCGGVGGIGHGGAGRRLVPGQRRRRRGPGRGRAARLSGAGRPAEGRHDDQGDPCGPGPRRALHDGVWGLPAKGGYPIQPSKLHALLTGLTELRLTEPRTSDPAEYARLGVDDPTAAAAGSSLLTVLDGAGHVISVLIVGHRRVRTQGAMAETVYVRRPGEAQSWQAEGQLAVDADPQLWIDRDIANIDHREIASATATRGAEVLTFARAGGAWGLTSPAAHPKLDDYKVEDVARAFENLTLLDVRPAARMPNFASGGEHVGTSRFTTVTGETIDVTVAKVARDKDAEVWAEVRRLGAGVGRVGEAGAWLGVPGRRLEGGGPRAVARLAEGGGRARAGRQVSREYPPYPIVGIGVAVLRPGAALLVRRGKPPNAGAWSLPGGAQEVGETAEEACRRELLEEAGLAVGPLLLAANVDSIHRDPDGRVRYHYTIIDFAARWAGGDPVAGGDATDAVWAPFARFDEYGLWSEARRVVGIARRLLAL